MNPTLRPGQTYVSSGRFGSSSLLLIPLLGVAAAAVTAAVYAYATLYIPFVGYFTVLLTAGFGFVVGVAAAKGAELGKARSGWLAAVLGLSVGLVALYLSWAFWIHALLRRSDVELALLDVLLDPAALWQMIVLVNAEGAWSVKGFTPTGTVLWVFWGIEALLIAGFPAFVCAGQAVSPFCERCLGWCAATKDVFRGADGPHDELERRLRSLEISHVASLGPAQPGADAYVRYDLHRCSCGATVTLTATAVKTTLQDGKPKESTSELLANVVLSREAEAALRRLGEAPPPAQAAAAQG